MVWLTLIGIFVTIHESNVNLDAYLGGPPLTHSLIKCQLSGTLFNSLTLTVFILYFVTILTLKYVFSVYCNPAGS